MAAASLIFRGGTILTMVEDRPRVEALAIADGRILAAGNEAEVMATAGEGAEVIDLAGRTLMPSFIDAHGHFVNALQIVRWVNVSWVPAGPVTCIADILRVLREHVAAHPVKPGEWIIGYGYDVSNLSDGRQLSRDDLDPVFPANPVLLIHSSNHGAVLNSAGFALVGIDASTPDPAGGLILRKAGGKEPDGLLMETAFLSIFAAMPQPTEEELLAAFDAAQQIYARGRPAGVPGGTGAGGAPAGDGSGPGPPCPGAGVPSQGLPTESTLRCLARELH
ncbi:MAG: amidohydrolase [Cyanobium sp.]